MEKRVVSTGKTWRGGCIFLWCDNQKKLQQQQIFFLLLLLLLPEKGDLTELSESTTFQLLTSEQLY